MRAGRAGEEHEKAFHHSYWIVCCVTCLAASAPSNVVFILIDDLSHSGITAYGANKISSTQGFFKDVEFATPRINSLAEDGLRCDYAYAYPLCEPTRIALMSGMNNIRNDHQCKSQHASDITFARLRLQAALVAACAGINRSAFVALRPARGVCFGIKQTVKRLLCRAAHQLL